MVFNPKEGEKAKWSCKHARTVCPSSRVGLDGSCSQAGRSKKSANTGTRIGDDPVDKGTHSLDLCIITSPMLAPFLGKPDSHKHMASLQGFCQHVWITQLQFPPFPSGLLLESKSLQARPPTPTRPKVPNISCPVSQKG